MRASTAEAPQPTGKGCRALLASRDEPQDGYATASPPRGMLPFRRLVAGVSASRTRDARCGRQAASTLTVGRRRRTGGCERLDVALAKSYSARPLTSGAPQDLRDSQAWARFWYRPQAAST